MKILLCSMLVLFAFSASQAQVDEWEIVPSQNLGSQANSLLSVAAVSGNDVWAVGTGYDQSLVAYRTVIEHWNGMSWSIVSSPNATNGSNILNGVAVAGPNDIWAVGQALDPNSGSNAYSTLVEHFSAKEMAWQIVPSPNGSASSNVLTAITVLAPNNIWAVGYSTDSSFHDQALAMHWDGTTWSITPTPVVGGDILFAVSSSSPDDVWAVGRSRPGYANGRTLTMHWNGQTWTVVPSPNDGSSSNNLYGVVSLTGKDVWAVGAAGSSKTLALHGNGANWSLVTTPGLGANANNQALVGITALSSNDVWAAGSFYQTGIQQTLTEHWNGSNWSVVSSANIASSTNRLSGITVTPDGTLWAVGTTGPFGQPEQTLILRRRPNPAGVVGSP